MQVMGMEKIEELKGPLEPGLGMHLILNCRDCDRNKAKDMRFAYDFLVELTTIIGMNMISRPYVVDCTEIPGLTAAVYFDASAITLHTYPQRGTGFVAIDVYSCKPFEPRRVVEFVVKKYAPERTEQLLIKR